MQRRRVCGMIKPQFCCRALPGWRNDMNMDQAFFSQVEDIAAAGGPVHSELLELV